jgi:hypothetical protein
MNRPIQGPRQRVPQHQHRPRQRPLHPRLLEQQRQPQHPDRPRRQHPLHPAQPRQQLLPRITRPRRPPPRRVDPRRLPAPLHRRVRPPDHRQQERPRPRRRIDHLYEGTARLHPRRHTDPPAPRHLAPRAPVRQPVAQPEPVPKDSIGRLHQIPDDLPRREEHPPGRPHARGIGRQEALIKMHHRLLRRAHQPHPRDRRTQLRHLLELQQPHQQRRQPRVHPPHQQRQQLRPISLRRQPARRQQQIHQRLRPRVRELALVLRHQHPPHLGLQLAQRPASRRPLAPQTRPQRPPQPAGQPGQHPRQRLLRSSHRAGNLHPAPARVQLH